MASIQRRPLAPKPPTLATSLKSRSTSSLTKRPRSPDGDAHSKPVSAKRLRPSLDAVKERKEKKLTKEEREQAKEDFRIKYTKAFPTWVFYFDTLDPSVQSIKQSMESSIRLLGGRVEEFFSSSVTHFITNRPRPDPEDVADLANKENSMPRSLAKNAGTLRSPIKLRGRAADEGYDELIVKAVRFNMKLWGAEKFRSVVSRLLSSEPASMAPPAAPSKALGKLLATEKLHGTTHERDPTQKRHDYTYFTKNSCFVLVEDMRGELAPIAAHEYTRPRGAGECPWPVLYADHRARGPFQKYSTKEKEREARRDKAITAEREMREAAKRALAQKMVQARELRKSVSMNNLGRKISQEECSVTETNVDPEASGYIAPSGYIAASGNSVAITSNTASTSTALGLRLDRIPALGKRIHQVITNNRALVAGKKGDDGQMEPPAEPKQTLRKSKSTTLVRLPPREETKKPGYCECCRVKFEDFTTHIRGTKHRRFARNPDNFLSLDEVLDRLARKPLEPADGQWGPSGQSDEEEL